MDATLADLIPALVVLAALLALRYRLDSAARPIHNRFDSRVSPPGD